jgi:hypothetical protein
MEKWEYFEEKELGDKINEMLVKIKIKRKEIIIITLS